MFARRTEWHLTLNAYTRAIEAARERGDDLLDLTVSNPTQSGFRYSPDILPSLGHPAGLGYRPEPKGLLSAREAVTRYYARPGETKPRVLPARISPEQLILTASTSEAYSYIFRLLCEPGDEVLVPHPGYPLFEFLAQIQDVRVRAYPLVYDHDWQMDIPTLSRMVTPRTRAVVVVHPNNPTGSLVRLDELSALNELCSRQEMAVIADEVFLDFASPAAAEAATSFSSNSGALTFTMSGLSKICGLPQMKLAWLVVSGPGELRTAALERLEVIADTYLSANTPVQLALPALLETRHLFITQVNERVSRNLVALSAALKHAPACQALEREAGWYATLRVPVQRSDEELAVRLIEEKNVLVHPGHFFDFEDDGYLVLSLITPEEVFAEGLRRILSFFA